MVDWLKTGVENYLGHFLDFLAIGKMINQLSVIPSLGIMDEY